MSRSHFAMKLCSTAQRAVVLAVWALVLLGIEALLAAERPDTLSRFMVAAESNEGSEGNVGSISTSSNGESYEDPVPEAIGSQMDYLRMRNDPFEFGAMGDGSTTEEATQTEFSHTTTSLASNMAAQPTTTSNLGETVSRDDEAHAAQLRFNKKVYLNVTYLEEKYNVSIVMPWKLAGRGVKDEVDVTEEPQLFYDFLNIHSNETQHLLNTTVPTSNEFINRVTDTSSSILASRIVPLANDEFVYKPLPAMSDFVPRDKGYVLGYVTPWNNRGYTIAQLFRYKFTHISPVWYNMVQKYADFDSEEFYTFEIEGENNYDADWIASVRSHAEEEIFVVPEEDIESRTNDINPEVAYKLCESSVVDPYGCSEVDSILKTGPKIVPRMSFTPISAENFMTFLQDKDTHEGFISKIVNFIVDKGFDGVVFEVPYTLAAVKLLQELSTELHKHDKLFILPIHPPSKMPPVGQYDSFEDQLDAAANALKHFTFVMADYVDFFNVMTYDFPTRTPSSVSPVWWVEESMRDLVNRTIDEILAVVPEDPENTSKNAIPLGGANDSTSETDYERLLEQEVVAAVSAVSKAERVANNNHNADFKFEKPLYRRHPLDTGIASREKFLMGLNIYGYVYGQNVSEPIIGNSFLKEIKEYQTNIGKSTKSEEEKRTDDISVWWWEKDGEYAIINNIKKRMTFYPSLRGLKLRIELAQRFGTGIGLWDIGQGFDSFYQLL